MDAKYRPKSEITQERHHANHVLFYLSLLVESLLEGIGKWGTPGKAERIAVHLSRLQEFVSQDHTAVRQALSSLHSNLVSAPLTTSHEWTKFIFHNWASIQVLSLRYGCKERCFSDAKFSRLRDLASGRPFFRVWWWRLHLGKAKRKWVRRICDA